MFVVVSLQSKDRGLKRSFPKKITVKDPILPFSPNGTKENNSCMNSAKRGQGLGSSWFSR